MAGRRGAALLGDRAIQGMFFQSLQQNKSRLAWVEALSNYYTSDQESETYRWLGNVPQMRPKRDGNKARQLSVNGIEIINDEFEAAIAFHKNDLRRDKTGQIQRRLNELLKRANDHWAMLLTTLLLNGETSACYDGKMFFAANHSEGESGTQSNLLTSGDYSQLNVGTPTNPTATEMADVLMVMIQHLYSLKDDQGEPDNETAMEFVAVCPMNLWGPTNHAVTKDNLAVAGGGNVENPLRGQDFKIKVLPNPRLTWTDSLVVGIADQEAKALIRQEEVPISDLIILGEGSDHYFKYDEVITKIESNRNVGYGRWNQMVKGTLS